MEVKYHTSMAIKINSKPKTKSQPKAPPVTNILVQDYLFSHSLAELEAEHGIETSAVAGEYMFSLNYNQITSKPSPLTNQCRGLILATNGKPLQESQVSGTEPVGETYVMARPMDRFFNMGDSNASALDFNDPETVFFEKLDGTLCILYFNPELNEWHVATRKVPMADKPITSWEHMTFRKLFEKALCETLNVPTNETVQTILFFNAWTSKLDKEITYYFELTTPMNRIVVNYQNFGLHILGCRNTKTGQEFDTRSGLFGIPSCPSHGISNLNDLLAFVGSKPPFEQEGIVVRDKNFNRIKVKSLAYLAYNKARDSTANSPRAVMELILTETLDDVFPVLDKFVQDKALVMQNGLRKLVAKVDSQFTEIMSKIEESRDTPVQTLASPQNERKMFALAVQEKNGWMSPLMDRFSGNNTGLLDYINKRKMKDTNEYPSSLLDTLVEMSTKMMEE